MDQQGGKENPIQVDSDSSPGEVDPNIDLGQIDPSKFPGQIDPSAYLGQASPVTSSFSFSPLRQLPGTVDFDLPQATTPAAWNAPNLAQQEQLPPAGQLSHLYPEKLAEHQPSQQIPLQSAGTSKFFQEQKKRLQQTRLKLQVTNIVPQDLPILPIMTNIVPQDLPILPIMTNIVPQDLPILPIPETSQVLPNFQQSFGRQQLPTGTSSSIQELVSPPEMQPLHTSQVPQTSGYSYTDEQLRKIAEIEQTFTEDFYEDIGIKTYKDGIKCFVCGVSYQYFLTEGKAKAKCINCSRIRCTNCKPKQTFKTIDEYIAHCEQHSNFICFKCNEPMNRDILKRHLDEDICAAYFRCLDCFVSFKYAVLFVAHIYNFHATDKIRWKFRNCKIDKGTAKYLLAHARTIKLTLQTDDVMECPHPGCGKAFSPDNALSHLKEKNLLGEIGIRMPEHCEPKIVPKKSGRSQIKTATDTTQPVAEKEFAEEFFEDIGLEIFKCHECTKSYIFFPGQAKIAACPGCRNAEKTHCRLCDPLKKDHNFQFESITEYIKHNKEKHPTSAPCYVCDAETSSPSLLTDHLILMKCLARFQCLPCSEAFDTLFALVEHKYKEHSIGMRKWKCKNCAIDIKKPDGCGICGKEAECVISCPHPGCGETFETNDKLLRHMKDQEVSAESPDVIIEVFPPFEIEQSTTVKTGKLQRIPEQPSESSGPSGISQRSKSEKRKTRDSDSDSDTGNVQTKGPRTKKTSVEKK